MNLEKEADNAVLFLRGFLRHAEEVTPGVVAEIERRDPEVGRALRTLAGPPRGACVDFTHAKPPGA